jgi:hypothetical protein
MDLQSHSSFVLKQRITFLVNRYEFFATSAGQPDRLAAFVEQKRLTLKEQITAYTSEDKSEVLFTIQAEKVLDVHGRYFVRDGQGQLLGSLRKVFGKSLLRSTWEVANDKDEVLFTAQESSQVVALFRRFADFIPFVGIIAEFVPFHFEFRRGDVVIGSYRRVITFRDQYTMTFEPAAAGIDRRLGLALGIALDALQSR